MHCEKCGSADTEIIKCGDCGQKSRIRCSNCGFSSCTDKYCSVIAIKRKIRILTYVAGMIFLVMLGTLPFVIRTYMDRGGNKPPTKKPTKTSTKKPTKPTKKPPATKKPTKPTVKPPATKKPTKPTRRPATKPATKPTSKPPVTKPATQAPTKPALKKGQFASQEDFEKEIKDKIKSGKGILFGKGMSRDSMNPHKFVKWVYSEIGWDIPHKPKQLAALGKAVTDKKDLRCGDILFFSMKGDKTPTFMGVYYGTRKGKQTFAFVFPKKGKGYFRAPVDHKFFKEKYLFARRLFPSEMPK